MRIAMSTGIALTLMAAVGTAILSTDAQSASPEPAASAKTILEQYVAAWNRHDLAAIDKLLDADSVHEDIPAGFHGQGPEQIKAFAQEVFKAQPDLKWHLTTIVQSGSTAAAEWTWTATYTGDGPNGPVKSAKISARGATFLVAEHGHIKRFVDYYDFASAFGAPAEPAK
jgi:steroid delta-isomerase-like uncharacterized protein